LKDTGIEDSVRTSVRAECVRTTTFFSIITSIKTKDERLYQLMFGNKPDLSISSRIFGEISVITMTYETQGKLKNRGLTCMFVGYSVDHANDVDRMLNLNSKRINETIYVFGYEKVTILVKIIRRN
jgi:hypothetical protein